MRPSQKKAKLLIESLTFVIINATKDNKILLAH